MGAAAVVALWTGVGRADHCPKPCEQTCAPCAAAPACPAPAVEWKDVERTVMVPEWGTEKRKIHTTEFRHETHDKQITVNEMVKKEEKKTREVTVYQRQVKSREEKFWIDLPFWKDVETKATATSPAPSVGRTRRR